MYVSLGDDSLPLYVFNTISNAAELLAWVPLGAPSALRCFLPKVRIFRFRIPSADVLLD